MPVIKFSGPDESARRKVIEKILPKEPLLQQFVSPESIEEVNKIIDTSWHSLIEPLTLALKREIEIYRKYPKKGTYNIKMFDPRTTDQCFMGQGFQSNGLGLEGWYDADLKEYRNAIGTIKHEVWGNCTLLEAWGGDHFTQYRSMVVAVMEYCWGKSKTLPELKIYINPLQKNSKSGTMIPSQGMKDQEKERERMRYIICYSEVKAWMKKHKTDNPMGFEIGDVTDEEVFADNAEDDDT